MKKKYTGPERREFPRVKYVVPLAYKVCKRKTVSSLLHGYTSNISQGGLLCNIKQRVKKGQIIWLAFDHTILRFCRELDQRALIYQSGILGKVVRIKQKKNRGYDVGIRFITREEKNLTHIFPKIHFFGLK